MSTTTHTEVTFDGEVSASITVEIELDVGPITVGGSDLDAYELDDLLRDEITEAVENELGSVNFPGLVTDLTVDDVDFEGIA